MKKKPEGAGVKTARSCTNTILLLDIFTGNIFTQPISHFIFDKVEKTFEKRIFEFLVDGFRPSVILTKNSIISSDVISDTSRLPNSF